jgi:DNA-binding MarR family transcriptional regulator
MNEEKSYEIINNLTMIIKIINRKINNKMDNKRSNLSSIMILKQLSSGEEKTLTEIAENLGLPNSTTSVLVDKLVKEGMLDRIRDEKDRRKVLITITEEGYKKMGEFLEMHMQNFRELIHTTNNEDADAILKGLETLAKVIQGED